MKNHLLFLVLVILTLVACGTKSTDKQALKSKEAISESTVKEVNELSTEADSLAAETAKLLEELNALEN